MRRCCASIERGQVLIVDGRVVLGDSSAFGDEPPEDAVFLGRIEGGRHVWGIRAPLEPPATVADAHVLDLRRAGTVFDDVSAQLVSSATALLNWHDNAQIQRRRRLADQAGQGRLGAGQPATGHEEFPRIDPAVICLVHDGADRVVLARQTVWPERMFSLLAGFVEAGESFETCVAREIAEEIGLTVRDVRYLGSQPWPFPRSLMVGFHALAIRIRSSSFNDGEIAEARWFTRDEVRAALTVGDWTSAAAIAVQTAAAGLDFDRPGDHRILGRPGLSRTAVRAMPREARAVGQAARLAGQLRLDLADAGIGQRRTVGELHRRHRSGCHR